MKDRKLTHDLKQSKKNESLILFQRAVEVSLDGIIIGELTGKITYVNDAAVKMYGGTDKNDFLGKHVLEFIAERDRAKAYQNSMDCLITGEGKVDEFNVIHKGDSEFLVEATTAVIKNEKNEAIGFIDILREITERKKAEQAIKRQASLIDLSPDAIIVRTLEGSITFWSKGAEALYGWKNEEAIGQKINEILQSVFPEPFESILGEIKQKGCWSGEIIHLAKNGRKVIVQSNLLAKIDKKGNVEEILESNVDVTERKQMQLKLESCNKHLEDLVEERTKQLRSSERFAAIGELAGMVGHDLRNPLASIKNATYFLKKKQASFIGESGDQMLTIIDKSVDHANKIINDLLDYSRELHLELEEYSPKSLLDYLLLTIKVPSNIKLSVHAQDFPLMWVDQSKMERVFINLVNNAFEAMPGGGVLKIDTCQIGQNIEFAFADTGTGMPKDVITKIFTPLFTTKAQGMGFGLAICKRIAEAHNGKITVESIINKGTTFTVSLPIIQEQIGFKNCTSKS